MGGCASRPEGVQPSKEVNNDVYHHLRTGDIVLLLDDTASSAASYMSKAGGSWTRASIAGFLVRDGPTSQGLCLYHADHLAEHGYAVTALNLVDELNSGRYRKAVVRQLYHPLTPEQEHLVKQFALLNNGKILGRFTPEPATVLMTNPCSGIGTSQAYERFRCSEFVATMLHLAGQIIPTYTGPQGGHQYAAASKKGYVLKASSNLGLVKYVSSVRLSGQSQSGGTGMTGTGSEGSPRSSGSSC